MKNKLSLIVFLFLAIILTMKQVQAVDPAPATNFITIYTTVFHPGPQLLANGSTVQWDFNTDGIIDSTDVNGSYVFPGPGTYNVKLITTNSSGVKNSTKTITINEILVLPPPPAPSNWMNTAWKGRVKLTIPSGKVTEDLIDFPVYIKLADLGNEFFGKVNSSCGDIRVTDSTGLAELSREIVACNVTNKTGELYFKASSLKAASNNDFYIYYGNPTAINYDNTATYGRNKVWTSDFELVAHFEENPGTSLFVNSTGGVSGTYTNPGGLATSAGLVGNSLDCSAISPIGYVDLDSFNANPNRNFAFSAFLNFSTTGVPQVFFEYAAPGGLNTRRVAAMFNPGKINWNHNNYDGIAELSATLSTGTWYHMSLNSLEEDSAHSKISTWLDGVSNISKPGYDSDNITANLGVICANRLFGESYNGKIDELRFYKNFKSNAWMVAEDINLRSPSIFYVVGAKESL